MPVARLCSRHDFSFCHFFRGGSSTFFGVGFTVLRGHDECTGRPARAWTAGGECVAVAAVAHAVSVAVAHEGEEGTESRARGGSHLLPTYTLVVPVNISHK